MAHPIPLVNAFLFFDALDLAAVNDSLMAFKMHTDQMVGEVNGCRPGYTQV